MPGTFTVKVREVRYPMSAHAFGVFHHLGDSCLELGRARRPAVRDEPLARRARRDEPRRVLVDVVTSAEDDALTRKNWVRKAWFAMGAYARCVVQLRLVELLVRLAE
jgi:hypothetical protein